MAIITMKKKQKSNKDIINFIYENFNCTVSDRLIRKIVQRYNETGNLTDRRRSGRRKKNAASEMQGLFAKWYYAIERFRYVISQDWRPLDSAFI